jgi:hypothetical protein
VAAVDPNHPGVVYGPTQGMYAGQRIYITANLQAGSPTTQNQTDYAQLYKAGDGHLYRVNLRTTSTPAPLQVSSESQATIDDTCSLNGANTLLGTDVNYVAVQFYNDFANPENSVYFYRVPGPNGMCNTAEDVVHMAKLGMLPAGTIMQGTGTLIDTAGYIDGINVNSTPDPATRELVYIDTSRANSLTLLTSNLN